jgi:hypothetical protein
MSYPITLPACKLLGPASSSTSISARLPPNSPRNATFALLADHRGMPVTRPANTRLVARIFTSDAYYAHGQPIPSICRRNPERFGSCEARRHRSDGKSTTLRSCRPRRSCSIAGCHAFEASMRRWGCAGRSYPSHSTSRSRAIWWERGAWREQVAPIQRSHIGMGLLCAQERSRQIRHIRMVNARPDART